MYREGRVVYAVAIDPVTGEPGVPDALFQGQYASHTNPRYRQYDVTRDGERFLMLRQQVDQLPRRIHVITNFFEELNRLVPVD